jgi:sugar-phosphatase
LLWALSHSFCFVKTHRQSIRGPWLLFWKMVLSAKAILFDMDGVLIDSAPAVERVWRVWALAHGFDPASVVAQAHGRRSIETIRAVAPAMDAEKENILVEQMEIDDKDGVTALPGAARLLAQLPDDRFAIVTSATRPLAVARLGYASLPVPRHIITADDVVHGKPSPEPYLKGAALLGFAPTDCLVFEDTPARHRLGAGFRNAGNCTADHISGPGVACRGCDCCFAGGCESGVARRNDSPPSCAHANDEELGTG